MTQPVEDLRELIDRLRETAHHIHNPYDPTEPVNSIAETMQLYAGEAEAYLSNVQEVISELEDELNFYRVKARERVEALKFMENRVIAEMSICIRELQPYKIEADGESRYKPHRHDFTAPPHGPGTQTVWEMINGSDPDLDCPPLQCRS